MPVFSVGRSSGTRRSISVVEIISGAAVRPTLNPVAYTEADLTAIRAARLRGVRTVQYSDRSMTYSSDAEMKQVEQDILKELNAASRRPKQSIGIATKGLR